MKLVRFGDLFSIKISMAVLILRVGCLGRSSSTGRCARSVSSSASSSPCSSARPARPSSGFGRHRSGAARARAGARWATRRRASRARAASVCACWRSWPTGSWRKGIHTPCRSRTGWPPSTPGTATHSLNRIVHFVNLMS